MDRLFERLLLNLIDITVQNRRTIAHHTRTIRRIMSDQEHLDADVAALTTATDAIAAEVEALKAAQSSGTPLDFTALDALVATIQGEVPVTPAA